MTEVQTARTVEVVAAEINALTASMLGNIVEIGRRMCEAKEMLPYGTFGTWIKENTGYSTSTANNFMRLFQEYGSPQGCLFGAQVECQTFGKLSYSKALALLSVPAEEREKFVEEHDVADMSTRELQQAIKERDEARKKAEDLEKAMEEQLEEQRTVYDTDMADIQGRLEEAENRAAGYAKKLEDAKAKAAAELEKAQADISALKAELEEVAEAPTPVAVETVVDEEAVKAAAEAARKEAAEQLKAKIEKAEQAKARAEQAKAKAEQELAAVKVAQEEARAIADREKEAMTEQMKALQKKLAVASSSEMTIFKLHFEQGQASIDKMTECIERMKDAGDGEWAGKLRNALTALLTTTLETLK